MQFKSLDNEIFSLPEWCLNNSIFKDFKNEFPDEICNIDLLGNDTKIFFKFLQTGLFETNDTNLIFDSFHKYYSISKLSKDYPVEFLYNRLHSEWFMMFRDYLDINAGKIERLDKSIKIEQYYSSLSIYYDKYIKQDVYTGLLFSSYHKLDYYNKPNNIKQKLFNTIIPELNNFTNINYDIETFFEWFFGDILILAGGAALSLYDNTVSNDLDFFFVNCTPDEAWKHLTKIFDPESNINKKNIMMSRNQRTITIGKLQFILQIYKSPAHVIHSFDIDACQIYYDSKQDSVMCTPSCLYSLKYRRIHADSSRYSYTYKLRLYKYVKDKHFDLFIPEYINRDKFIQKSKTLMDMTNNNSFEFNNLFKFDDFYDFSFPNDDYTQLLNPDIQRMNIKIPICNINDRRVRYSRKAEMIFTSSLKEIFYNNNLNIYPVFNFIASPFHYPKDPIYLFTK